MTNLPVPVCADAALVPNPAVQLIQLFLGGRPASTRKAYQTDLEDFRMFAGGGSPAAAISDLLRLESGQANGVALAYKNDLVARGLSASTTNRRLASLRSLISLAKTLGAVAWTLEIKNTKSKPLRDSRGPGTKGVTRILAQAAAHRSQRKAARDTALVRLLHDLGLRRSEVLGLDREHYNATAGTLSILGKGAGTERLLMTLPTPTKQTLDAWLAVRGHDAGPLFTSFDHSRQSSTRRLSGQGLYDLIRALGDKAGLGHVKPHGLRHSGITTALDISNGDVRSVCKFSRHSDIKTLLIYDDNRRDMGGDIARQVAAAV